MVTFFLCGLLLLVFSVLLKASEDLSWLGLGFLWSLVILVSLVCLSLIVVLVRPSRNLVMILEPSQKLGSVQTWSGNTLEQRVDLGGDSQTPFHFVYRHHRAGGKSTKIYHEVWLKYGNPEETAIVDDLPSEPEARHLLEQLCGAFGKSPGPDELS